LGALGRLEEANGLRSEWRQNYQRDKKISGRGSSTRSKEANNNRAVSFAGSAGVDGALKSVLFVLSLEQELGRRGATSAAAKKINMSRRSIQQALVKAESAAKLLIQLRDLQLKTRSSVPRYVVSPTALTPH
jgi:hypothetical protein